MNPITNRPTTYKTQHPQFGSRPVSRYKKYVDITYPNRAEKGPATRLINRLPFMGKTEQPAKKETTLAGLNLLV